jgi:hypothetical protein
MKRVVAGLSGCLLVAVVTASCTSTASVPNAKGSPFIGTSLTPSPNATPSASPTVRAPRIPVGAYQFDVTLQELQGIGSGVQGVAIEGNTGHYTIRVRSGRWRLVHTADHPISFRVMEGVYMTDGHRVTFELLSSESGLGPGSATCRWTFDPSKQLLTLKLLSARPAEFVPAAHVLFRLWRRTG